MTLDEIIKLWSEDSKIDSSDLSRSSLDIPLVHDKYYKIYSQERYRLRTMEQDQKILKQQKYEFYTQGPHEDTPPTWKLPAAGRILKSDAGNYVDTDPDVVKANLRIFAQSEKVDYLENIIKMINNRGYQIKNSLEWLRFTNGS